MNFVHLLILLLFAHALADYPLQGDFLSRAKNKFAPIPGVPWFQAMGAHVMIHAGFVYLITGNVAVAVAEMVIHGLTDHNKCAGRIGFNADQAIHISCKVLWAAIAGSLL